MTKPFLDLPDFRDFPKLRMPIIAFAGKSGAGKDTCAEIIHQYLWKTEGEICRLKSFANPLKFCLSSITSLERNAFSGQRAKNRPSELLGGRTPKELAQFFGTEMCRNMLHPDIWVHSAYHDLRGEQLTLPTTKIFTDCRFQNEHDFILAQNGLVIQLERNVEERGIPGHVSDKIKFQVSPGDRYHIIQNNGTVEELKEKIIPLVEAYRKWRGSGQV